MSFSKKDFARNDPGTARRFRVALILSHLPYNRGLYRAGGWTRSDGPGTPGWRTFLARHFPAPVLRTAFRDARLLLERLRTRGIDFRAVTIWEDDYPAPLKAIFDPPPVLFVRGPLPDPAATLVAVVGTRAPMPFTIDLAHELARSLGEEARSRDLSAPVIVSGFARGVDRQAHLAAITAGLPTLAVLGMGVDRPGPASNLDLIREAHQRESALTFISEFPPGMPGYPGNFPRRNRVIAGLAGRVVLLQAPHKSGAMITARFALEEGREVSVFDHPILNERANGGCRELAAAGAGILRFPEWEARIVREPPFPGGSNPGHDPKQLAFWRERATGNLRRIAPGVYWRVPGKEPPASKKGTEPGAANPESPKDSREIS